MDYKRNQHSVYLLTYHTVFVVKHRKKVLTQEMLDYMKNQVSHLMEGYGGSLIDLNGEADHIHILFELPPRSVLSNLICNLKRRPQENSGQILKQSFLPSYGAGRCGLKAIL